jgi:hypothetical protein
MADIFRRKNVDISMVQMITLLALYDNGTPSYEKGNATFFNGQASMILY